MRRVIINTGYYDIAFTTELVFFGFDPRCVEDLFDAFLQAGVVDGVIDAPSFFIPSILNPSVAVDEIVSRHNMYLGLVTPFSLCSYEQCFRKRNNYFF